MTYIIHRLVITTGCALFLSMIGSLFFALAYAINCVITHQISPPDWEMLRATAIVWAAGGAVMSWGVHYD